MNHNRHTDSMEKICEELSSLVPLYSIGAVLPEERRFVEQMLPYCPEAAEELADYASIAEGLVYAVPQNEAPPAVDGLMARVQQYERAQHTVAEHHVRVQPPPLNTLPSAPMTLPLPAPTQKPRSRWLGLVAAVLLVVLFAGTNLYWAAQLEALRQEQRLLFEQLAATPPTAVLTGSDHHRHLTTTGLVSDHASAVLIWNSGEQIGTLYVSELPELPADQAYQVWLMRDGHHITLGTFSVDASGVGSLVFYSPEPVESFQIVGISAERAAGTESPTTPHVLTAEI